MKNTCKPGKAKTIFCGYFSVLQKEHEGRTKQPGPSDDSRTGVKGKPGDVPQPETVHEKMKLSLKDSLSLDPLKKQPNHVAGSNLEQPVKEKINRRNI